MLAAFPRHLAEHLERKAAVDRREHWICPRYAMRLARRWSKAAAITFATDSRVWSLSEIEPSPDGHNRIAERVLM